MDFGGGAARRPRPDRRSLHRARVRCCWDCSRPLSSSSSRWPPASSTGRSRPSCWPCILLVGPRAGDAPAGHLDPARTIEGIAGAAGIGLGAAFVFLLLDVVLLQNIGTYTNRWWQIGGSNWWYHPIWWMVGTFLPWFGAWILANQAARNGRISAVGRLRHRGRASRVAGRRGRRPDRIPGRAVEPAHVRRRVPARASPSPRPSRRWGTSRA